MSTKVRTVFYVSDGTGITAETLGHALLTQFHGIEFREVARPFVNSAKQVDLTLKEIEQAGQADGNRPLVFSTIVDAGASARLGSADAQVFDVLECFVAPLERELDQPSNRALGRSNKPTDRRDYHVRMDAVNFALAHDDGAALGTYERAEVILAGVSRSGKTPTCIYLSMQFGLKAANYPITEEDLEGQDLPEGLRRHRNKLFGLTIDPEALASIRAERRPNSRYASLAQCRREVEEVEALFRRFRIPTLDTTTVSVEEISSKLIQVMKLQRRLYY